VSRDVAIGLLVGVAYLTAQTLAHVRAAKIVHALDRLSKAIMRGDDDAKDVNGEH
jgi:hypothetical protein